MFEKLKNIITNFSENDISEDRKKILLPVTEYIKDKVSRNETIRLNFICTHNSRRSHLAQIWAQTMAFYFEVQNVFCYSGGTEATAMYPKIAETLSGQGFQTIKIADAANPVYAIKFSSTEAPVICFSKKYDHALNPSGNYAAIMTCNQADVDCPIVFGAEARFPLPFEDPKMFDNTDLQEKKYNERSLEIAREMWWVMKKV